MRIFIFLISFIFSNILLNAQGINMSIAPKKLQLYTRNLTTNQAQVELKGSTGSILYSNVVLKVFKNNLLVNTQSQTLNFNTQSKANFAFSYNIVAGLDLYDFRVYLDNFVSLPLVYTADSVVCGDAYIIYGQSNAVSRLYSGNAEPFYSSAFARSFGYRGNTVTPVVADTSWYVARGDGNNFGSGLVGQWAIVMAKKLIDAHQIPVAIINGAYPGAPIATLIPDGNNANNINTHYGRLNYRLNKAKITQPRAIIYYQGESDGDSVATYTSHFSNLLNTWNNQFLGLEKVYVFQVHPFCKQFISGASLRLRDTQRLFFTQPKVSVMSSSAISGLAFDSCHYVFSGNLELGQRIFRLISRDIYNSTDTLNIEAPNIKRAYICHPNNKEVALEFYNKNDSLALNTGLALKYFIFENDTNKSIAQYNIDKNILGMEFYTPLTSPSVSYDAPSGFHRTEYVTNTRGVGALAFYGVPIEPYTPETVVANLKAHATDSGSIVLTWNTTSERNNQVFYVQEWVSDTNYVSIDTVSARNTPSNYRYTVTNLFKGTYAYRIAHVQSKKYFYTTTDSVQARVQRYNLPPIFTRTFIFPHPINTKNSTSSKLVVVPRISETLALTLYNALGQKIKTMENIDVIANQSQVFSLNFEGVPPNFYYLTLQGQQSISTLRIIVQ